MTHEEAADLIREMNAGIEILAVFVTKNTSIWHLAHLVTTKRSLSLLQRDLADRWAADFDGMSENPYITRRGDV